MITQNVERPFKGDSMIYDIIIIGAGPAGLTAALYACRSGFKTLILEKTHGPGGVMASTQDIENWPGIEKIGGKELASNMAEHAKKSGTEIKYFADVQGTDLHGSIKKIKTSAGEFESHAVILATGTIHAHLGVPGEEKLLGAGVSYCAPCDATFFKDMDVAIIGGGNSALSQALFLSKIAKNVTLIHRRDGFKAEKAIIDHVKGTKNISLVLNNVVIAIIGEENVTGLKIKDVNTGKEKELDVAGVFIYVGLNPNSHIFANGLKMDELGFIAVDENMQTNMPGVFAAGDVSTTPLRQIVTAAGNGATAAMSAGKYLREKK